MAFSVPTPCAEPWAGMTPTAAGRHCGRCQHEVVDFSGMSETEVVAWLARPTAGTVCGYFRAGQFAPPPAPRWRRWLLATVALVGLKPLLVACQTSTTASADAGGRGTEQTDATAAAPNGQVTVRGRVLDDSTGQGVAGAEIFIADTPYGAVTDEQGNFTFTMLEKWAPVQQGQVQLRVQGSPFVFEKQTVAVRTSPAPTPLTVRLKSVPGRGQIMGRIAPHEPPQKPPLK